MTVAPVAGPPFTGALAAFRDALRWRDDEQSDPAGPVRTAVLARFQACYGGAWRPACSLWGQIYFNMLLIPATCLIAAGGRAGAFAAGISASFCPATGRPKQFALCGAKRGASPDEAEQALVGLLDAHLARVVEELSREARLSDRMLWESADRALRWASARIALGEPACARRLEAAAGRAGAGSRLARAWSAAGEPDASRRFCCLRRQLPGLTACRGVCPVGERRARPV